MMYFILKRYLENDDIKLGGWGLIPAISEDKSKKRIVKFQRSEARSALKENVRNFLSDKLTQKAVDNIMSSMNVNMVIDHAINKYLHFSWDRYQSTGIPSLPPPPLVVKKAICFSTIISRSSGYYLNFETIFTTSNYS